MLAIKCSKKGYLVGFEEDGSPKFGDQENALEFDISDACDLCFELDDQDSTLNTVEIS